MKKILSLFIVLSLCLSAIPFSAVTFAAEKELLHYSFEKDNEGWTYWSDKKEKSTYPVTEASTDGDRALFLYDTTKLGGTGIQSAYIDVVPGKKYTALASALVAKTKITFYFRYFTAEGGQILNENVSFTKSVWEERAITIEAPKNAAKARILIVTGNLDIGGGYIDDVKFVEGEVAARGNLNVGKKPAKMPAINEIIEKVPVVDDGYEDGQIIYEQSFENGIDDWMTYVNDASYKVVEEYAADGKYSLYIIDNDDTSSAGAKSKKFPVAQGNTYTAYFDVYQIKAGTTFYMRFYDSANKQAGQFSLYVAATGWNKGRLSVIAPEKATQVEVFYAGGTATTSEAYYDNIKIYKGNMIAKPDETDYKEPVQPDVIDSKIVEPVDGKLKYNTYNDMGDTLSDFSYAGYYAGEVELPDTASLPVAAVVSPTGTEDDTGMLQDVIDKVYNEAKNDKLKVIKLKAGTYYINKNGIKLKSGILLSGEGQHHNGTILYAKDKTTYTVIQIVGEKPVRTSGEVPIVDDYVKSGSKVITVSDASEFKVGDLICIMRPSSEEWVEAMNMKDVVTVYGDKVSWQKNMVNTKSERTITAINGNQITLDYGVYVPYERKYTESYIYRMDDSGRIHDVGVENLRVVSYFNGDPLDNNHAKMAITAFRAKNIFVRNITAKNMFNGVFGCRDYATQITVQNCSNIDPVSTIVGGNRYVFYAEVDTEKILFTGCYAYDGRHDYMAVSRTSGPVVFHDSISDMSNAPCETHAGFCTGVLFDNLYQITDNSKGWYALANRGLYGVDTPQGWTAGGSVAWNCLSNSILANKPPLTYENFLVGMWGNYNNENIKTMNADGYQQSAYKDSTVEVGPDSAFETKEGTILVGDSYKEAEFNAVNPRSLFKAQLAERFTGNIENAKPNAPVVVYPRPDKEVPLEENKVAVTGVYQKGAEKVYVYIDDAKYSASMSDAKNEFKITMRLTEGIHKIYATQVIDGVEGNKTADRFIIVGEKGDKNPDYLQSFYPNEVTSLISNDNRPIYNEYIENNPQLFEEKIRIYVNNAYLETDVTPVIKDSRVLVPMRSIFEALEVEVSYDENTKTATAVGEDGTTVKVTEDSMTAYVNGKEVALDSPATIVDGRFLVPVRFVSEAFKAKVGWNDPKKMVTVNGAAPQYTETHGLDNELFAYEIIQSGDDGAGNVIKNAFDGDYATRWGVLHDPENPGQAYGIIYLGKLRDIDSLYISHTGGKERVYTFDVYVSDDNVSYTLVKEDLKSSGTTTELEKYEIGAKGRYLKIVGKGNSVNNWMNIQEIAITGK